MTVLAKREIAALIQAEPPLVAGWLDIDAQIQPNGFDMTVGEVARLVAAGAIAVDNQRRRVSESAPLEFDRDGGIDLAPGGYLVTVNEVVNLPRDVMALATPRSSLLRCGVTVNTAVWDAGYTGRSQALMVVYNPAGFRLEKDARIIQLVFFRLDGETEGYNGVYQGENI